MEEEEEEERLVEGLLLRLRLEERLLGLDMLLMWGEGGRRVTVSKTG